jgi:hypothetical protein
MTGVRNSCLVKVALKGCFLVRTKIVKFALNFLAILAGWM